MKSIREQLYDLCARYLATKAQQIKKVIDEAQDAANNETKSSAGDKYETGREVMQQEIDLNTARLSEIDKLTLVIKAINPAKEHDVVVPGAVVYTNNGNFYIAVSAGKLQVGSEVFYAISSASPIGGKMLGQRAGHSFELNGKKYTIDKIC